MNVNKKVNVKKNIIWDDDDNEIIEPFSPLIINKLFDSGKTSESIISMYPTYSREISQIFWSRE